MDDQVQWTSMKWAVAAVMEDLKYKQVQRQQ